MSDQTTGSAGHALKSLFGTLTAGSATKHTANGKRPASQVPSVAGVSADTPPVVFDGVRPAGVPHISPPGTLVVLDPASTPAPKPVAAPASPIGITAPVYDFRAPSDSADPAPRTADSSVGITRRYDFPAPEP